ncbi:protein FAM183A isoform 2 [Gallus gallus]|uniref:Family with sequence similarity 183 member A n=1 Tax=Gallus gallus TaxID=9031 RepID=A0A8V0ZQI3_CHICK|nr:cilia- and flagella-associated protein 144 isoform 2 [Gallus gallus]
MAARGGKKEPPDAVHLNRLLYERVRKELRCQRLHTEHSINPLRPVHAVTQKPMSWHDNIEEPADGEGNDPCPPTAGAGGGSVVSF